MEFSKHNWATISETICPEMLIFGKQASWTLFFQNILTNPMISEISFLWRHTLVLYSQNILLDGCHLLFECQQKNPVFVSWNPESLPRIMPKFWRKSTKR